MKRDKNGRKVALNEAHAEFGKRLKQTCQERGISLAAAARLCGLSTAYLSELSRGTMSPTLTTLIALSNGFQVPLASWLEDVETSIRVDRGETRMLFSTIDVMEFDEDYP